jgi:hypothetical protein
MTSSTWNAEDLLAAANEWVWMPGGSRHIRTAEFLAVAPPDYMACRSWSGCSGPTEPVVR